VLWAVFSGAAQWHHSTLTRSFQGPAIVWKCQVFVTRYCRNV